MNHSEKTELSNLYDFFISYTHTDNQDNWIMEFIDALEKKHLRYSPNRYKFFFDHSSIRTMDDWEHRILDGLRSSKLMIAILAPKYFKSEYCHREWKIFREHELDKSIKGEGIAPIYIESVASFDQNRYEENNTNDIIDNEWFIDLHRRQYLDFRPWRSTRPSLSMDPNLVPLIEKLEQEISSKIKKVEQIVSTPTNLPPHNVLFTGRNEELRLLREKLALQKIGNIVLLQGINGSGKSALAFEYGHQYAGEYPGGRFIIDCSDKTHLLNIFKDLADLLNIKEKDHDKLYLKYVPNWNKVLVTFCYLIMF